jgi:hypothetical protein
MDHATKECELVNFHGQAFDAYAYAFVALDRSPDVFHKNKLKKKGCARCHYLVCVVIINSCKSNLK